MIVHLPVESISRGARRVAIFLIAAVAAFAHDIPVDATVQAFVKPEGNLLHFVVRVPLQTMRDVDVPVDARGFLDLNALRPQMPDAATLWIGNFVRMYEDDNPLPRPRVVATQISLPSDKSFATFDQAVAHLHGAPLGNEVNAVWNQMLLDAEFDYPIQSDRDDFSMDAAVDGLAARVNTVLRFLPPGGAVRAYEFSGNPGLIRLDPSWFQAALSFIRMGFEHILDGTDHLLFLLCLVIPFRRFRGLIPIVTAFTAAHSITLIASAYGLAPDFGWFPPLIEVLIALSILYMALENIAGGATVHRRWILAFGFGLVHGFGFSFALRQAMQFAGAHMLSSLLAFNVGVELGQLLVLLLVIPLLILLFRYVVKERMGTIILSALVAHTAWHWMMDRFDAMRKFPFTWPELGPEFIAGALRWAMAIVALGGAVWLVDGFVRKRARPSSPQSPEHSSPS
ncbi:MAG TPA: HupE/UreJ family protein [Bryobacteraceae bacterium]|nr:HupE/UreJ family protein [Bryobacteraceae bacterium]